MGNQISKITTASKYLTNFAELFSSTNKQSNSESIFSNKPILYGSGIVASSLAQGIVPNSSNIIKGLKCANILLLGFFTYKFVKEILKSNNDKNSPDVPDETQTDTDNNTETQEVKENTPEVKENTPEHNEKAQTKEEKPQQKTETKTKKINILVIDNFVKPDANYGNETHGKVITDMIKSELPDANISTMQANATVFSIVADEIRKGKKYDAINFSQTQKNKFNFKDILIYDSKHSPIKITQDNIKQYKKEIQEYIMKIVIKDIPNMKEILEDIEFITNSGTKIFIANNNHISNTLTLTDIIDFDERHNGNNPNLITVSAKDNKERHFKYSDCHEQSSLPLKEVPGGYDFIGDNKPEITNPKIIQNIKDAKIKTFDGNSMATPIALIRHFKSR